MIRELTMDELSGVSGNEMATLGAIMAVLAIGIIVVICYRFFMSNKGSAVLPGGYTFNWGK